MKGLSGSLGGFAFVGVIGLMVVPLPSAVLDVLLAVSLCLALLTFMVALYVNKPVDFSAFPSLLLLVTLLRLSLNVATTRRILLYGHEGLDAAGGMIRAFGEFAVGGNYVVGTVVFLILVAVNYIVITKGAERISEVTARFTLDKIPGKQMAIDADLNAGHISEPEARARRRAIEEESEFYGSMDGASKFVRGDAIAGLVITIINVVGGIVVGMTQHGMTAAEAGTTFTILSIGDGLVSQIPALVVSTGAALLTTRGSGSGGLGGSLGGQLLGNSRPLFVAGSVAGLLGFMPGMPHLAMLVISGGLILLARKGGFKPEVVDPDHDLEPEAAHGPIDPNDPEIQKSELQQMMPVQILSMRVALNLLPMLDAARGGELLTRIAKMRRDMAMELGVIVPPMHVVDDIGLPEGTYVLEVRGAKIAEAKVRMGMQLAIDPTGTSTRGIRGEEVKEPTFGLPAKWISASEKARAEMAGCAVVDPSGVIATHLTEVMRQTAHELLGRKEAQDLIDIAARQDERLVDELIPGLLTLGEIIKVLRGLLREGVSIRDIRTILETLADNAGETKDPMLLTEKVRRALGRQITQANLSPNGELKAMLVEPGLEQTITGRAGPVDPEIMNRAMDALQRSYEQAAAADEAPVLVVHEPSRRTFAEIARRTLPGLTVLSYAEVDPSVPFVTRSIVNLQEPTS